MEKMKLSPPWITYYKELKALFAQDEEVRVIFDQVDMEIKVFVDNAVKAEALRTLLNETVTFGNITLRITVVPSNTLGDEYANVYQTAFKGNGAFVNMICIDCPLGNYNYVVWQCSVVQFFDDNLGDPNGNCSTLYEAIARDVLKPQLGFYHCTDSMALGDRANVWP